MPANLQRSSYPFFYTIATRWRDNDVYGHVNNVEYYAFFDSAVNYYLITHCGLDIHKAQVVAYVVSSSANYFAPLSYPESVDVGVRVNKLGRSSVSYELGVFASGGEEVKAEGQFVHVFVDRHASPVSAVSIPENILEGLKKLV